MAFKKGQKKPNCTITFSYRRKCKLFGGENWKNKPYLKRRLLDHLGFISRYVVLSPLLHLFIPSLFNLSPSSSLHLFRSVPFLSLSSSHPKTTPSTPLLRSPLLHFFIPSLFNLSLSSSLHLSRALSFPFPSLFISPPENYPFCSSLLLKLFFLFKSKGRSLDLELIFIDKMGFINFFYQLNQFDHPVAVLLCFLHQFFFFKIRRPLLKLILTN